jgi:hypothetical protein
VLRLLAILSDSGCVQALKCSHLSRFHFYRSF